MWSWISLGVVYHIDINRQLPFSTDPSFTFRFYVAFKLLDFSRHYTPVLTQWRMNVLFVWRTQLLVLYYPADIGVPVSSVWPDYATVRSAGLLYHLTLIPIRILAINNVLPWSDNLSYLLLNHFIFVTFIVMLINYFTFLTKNFLFYHNWLDIKVCKTWTED